MICLAAISPHTPLLIPTIGKEHVNKVELTLAAMRHLADECYASYLDTMVVISSHTVQHQNAFSLNLHDEYVMDFKDFGDLATSRIFEPDIELSNAIEVRMHERDIPFTLDSDATLDYGTGVPLYFLTEHLRSIKIVPLSYAGLPPKEHVRFGKELKEVLEQSKKRIAVIASGDLSHCLSSDAPLGYRPEGEVYDQKILEAVKNVSTSTLLSLDPDLRARTGACIHEQLLILFGILERKKLRTEILSYEHPFGVGYLVSQFHL